MTLQKNTEVNLTNSIIHFLAGALLSLISFSIHEKNLQTILISLGITIIINLLPFGDSKVEKQKLFYQAKIILFPIFLMGYFLILIFI